MKESDFCHTISRVVYTYIYNIARHFTKWKFIFISKRNFAADLCICAFVRNWILSLVSFVLIICIKYRKYISCLPTTKILTILRFSKSKIVCHKCKIPWYKSQQKLKKPVFGSLDMFRGNQFKKKKKTWKRLCRRKSCCLFLSIYYTRHFFIVG